MKMMFKYLKTKNSRRRGIALEMAIFVLLLCFGLSILIMTTTMVQKSNYNRIISEQTEKLELERIGAEFCTAVRKDNIDYFEWKVSEETNYKPVCSVFENMQQLIIQGENFKIIVEVTKVEDDYKITRWELK
jgi:hypothetical protein